MDQQELQMTCGKYFCKAVPVVMRRVHATGKAVADLCVSKLWAVPEGCDPCEEVQLHMD